MLQVTTSGWQHWVTTTDSILSVTKPYEIRVSSSGGASGDGRRSTPLERTADVDSTTPMALLNLTTLSVFQKLLKILATQVGKKKSPWLQNTDSVLWSNDSTHRILRRPKKKKRRCWNIKLINVMLNYRVYFLSCPSSRHIWTPEFLFQRAGDNCWCAALWPEEL